MAKTALMIIAQEEFRDEEYAEPRKVLEENGVQVLVASRTRGVAIGKFGLHADVDIELKDVDTRGYNVIIYVGGPGCKQYWDDPIAHRIARECIAYNKVLAAICSAPVTLARAGLLKDKKATCHGGDAGELKREGAIYTGASLEQDGIIITAEGPRSAVEFAARIVQTLQQIG